MSNNLNFFEVVNVWSDDELSLFRYPEPESLIELQNSSQLIKQDLSLNKRQSLSYIQQFLVPDKTYHHAPQQNHSSPTLTAQSAQISLSSENSTKNTHEEATKKHKKIKKTQNSPFHNYQKHLNNALKTLIIVPTTAENDQDYKQAAWSIWNRYCQISIKTKRVLHYIFNEHNEHSINQPELKTYGLLNIYRDYGQATVKKAKSYISKLAIDQIDDANIEGYLKSRKIKRTEGLKDYVLAFKHQLQTGYLKRRINCH